MGGQGPGCSTSAYQRQTGNDTIPNLPPQLWPNTGELHIAFVVVLAGSFGTS